MWSAGLSLMMVGQHERQPLCVRHQELGVLSVYFSTFRLDLVGPFELGEEKRSEKIRQAEGRTMSMPGVFVSEAIEELTSIRALVEQDMCCLEIIFIIDHQCPALATNEVLRFVEAQRREAAKAAKLLATVISKEPMRIVLNKWYSVSLSDYSETRDIAGHTGVVHGNDCLYSIVH